MISRLVKNADRLGARDEVCVYAHPDIADGLRIALVPYGLEVIARGGLNRGEYVPARRELDPSSVIDGRPGT